MQWNASQKRERRIAMTGDAQRRNGMAVTGKEAGWEGGKRLQQVNVRASQVKV